MLCIRQKRGLSVSQVTLRSLTDDGLMRFALWGNDWGLCPKPQQGTLFPAPFLRFAAVLRREF